ncbi:uncharacterized protein LOC106694077 [Microplitis demolitor]|uniref:uncharacterized protein LOC106694077 n=1 Tax=Microplitis demolitor TaxID=69319 RepID=UPI0006D4DF3D|nr:uncharacterized protein LOC106694077 [Microplitis demolitor]
MGICHMIKELRLCINGVEIDQNSNVGITSLMKGYLTFSPSELSALENVGWLSNDDTQLTNADGYFDILIPLNLLSGFAEDYQKILINVQLELVLTISNTNINAYIQNPAEEAAAENDKVTLQKIQWIVPYVTLSDKERIQVLNYITGDPSIPISFRTWELYEYPLLPTTPRYIWAVKTSTQLEKPRCVVLGFQSARKNDARKNASQFDHCSIRNIKLFLNSQSYPHGDLNLMIDQNQYTLLYSMYTNFQSSYYDK